MSAIWNLACAYETLLRIELFDLPATLNDLPYTFRDMGPDDMIDPDVDTWQLHKRFPFLKNIKLEDIFNGKEG